MVEYVSPVSPNVARAIEAFVATQRTLEDVIRDGLARVPRAIVRNVVVQDEYTHDVVLPWGDGVHIAYDTT
jgi:hypothetical protein